MCSRRVAAWFRRIVVFGFTLAAAAGAYEPSEDSGWIRGHTVIGAPGIRESMAQISARDRLAAGQPQSPRSHLPHGHQWRTHGPPGTGGSGPSQNPTGPRPMDAQTVSPTLNFTAATYYDCFDNPPDTIGAAGPSQFVIALNGRIRSFDKTTGLKDGAIDTATDPFFNSVMTPFPNGNFTSDIRIRFDRLSGRWYISMIDVPGRNGMLPNRVMLAMSDSDTISTNTFWTFFYFQGDSVSGDPGDFVDYPTLGIDANALYIGGNMIDPSGMQVDAAVFVVQKSSLLSGGPIVVTGFNGLLNGISGNGLFTPQGADNYDPAATEGYIIGIDAVASTSRLRLRRVSDPGGTPTISANITIPVSPYSPPINVPHLGNTLGPANYLDCVDHRLIAAHFRNGLLWTSHNIGVDNTGSNGVVTRDGVRWYAITNIPTDLTPTVSQWGTVFQPSDTNSTDQRSYWVGTIMVSGQGHAAMGFSAAGQNEYINAGTCGRWAQDPPGTMQPPVLFTASSWAYNPPQNRWGDFSYTSLDPSDDMTMWTVQEWCAAPNIYGVQVVKLLAPPPALPTNCSPNTLTQGVATVNVTISGLSLNGAGFFEPGGSFPRHLSLTVNGGGITVNLLSWQNPTTLIADLSVAADAIPGPRTITVTNPDGQSAISLSALLSIVSDSNYPPVLAAIPNQTIHALTTLVVTNYATDLDFPPQLLSFSLDPGPPDGAAVDPVTGVFMWTPSDAQIGLATITTRVTDNGSPALSDAKTFQVNVLPRPTLSMPSISSNVLTLAWSSIAGTSYRLQFKTNLTDAAWTDLIAPMVATNAMAIAIDTNLTTSCFYRVLVGH